MNRDNNRDHVGDEYCVRAFFVADTDGDEEDKCWKYTALTPLGLSTMCYICIALTYRLLICILPLSEY